MTDKTSERMMEIDAARLETSLKAVRDEVAKLDWDFDKELEKLINKRQHLVTVIWTIKSAMGQVMVDDELERRIDWLREMAGMPDERIEIHRIIRLASRPKESSDE